MRVIVLCLLAAVTLDQQHSVSSSSWECIVLCCCCRDHQSLGGIETKKFASKWNVSLLLWNFHWLHIHDILHGAGRTTQCCAGYLVTLHSSSSPHWLWLMLSASMPLCPASAPLRPVCVAGSKEQAGDGTVWTLGASCCSLATVSTFPQFLTERGRDGSPLVLQTIHRFSQSVFPLWLLCQWPNFTSN